MFLLWIDYLMIGVLLCVSMFVGIYHGCIRSKQLTTDEFLIGNGRMGVFPTAMSLYASLVSASTLLSVPVEIYTFGTKYLFYLFGWFIGVYFTVNLFIPKFRQLQCKSIYVYLEKRFSLVVRTAVTIVFTFVMILFMAVNLYGPSLTLSQVTGLNMWLSITGCGLICTLYTSIGGIKAVIWTDVVQGTIMYLGVIVSIIYGFINIGGVRKVLEINMKGDRFNFPSVSLDPSIRYTYLSLILGSSLYGTAAYACLQVSGQRFLCVKSTKAAQRVAWLGYIFMTIVLSSGALVAMLLYAKYSQCDPLKAKLIEKPDQLYPLFIVQIFEQYPGLIGIFIGSILSASLSTISSTINSITTVLIEDIYKRITIFPSISQRHEVLLSKILSVILGVITIIGAFVMSLIENNITVIVYQTVGSFVPPILGVFLIGFFAPRVNSRSVLLAFILCILFQTWVLIGANLTIRQYVGRDGRLSVSVDGCLSLTNQSLSKPAALIPKSSLFLPLYSISFLWYNINGVFITIILALLFSLFFGLNDPKLIDKSLSCTWKDLFGFGSSTQVNSSIIAEQERLPLERE